jgi:XTP/dITP diphosphohydrolase
MDLLIATRNRGKAAEFAQMLSGAALGELRLRSLEELDDPFEPQETGRTFRANAVLKAGAYARRFKTWTLADDSGLAVDALGGRPGVHSARFAELASAGSGDEANNRYLLDLLKSVPDERRKARFICVLAISDARGRTHYTAEGCVEGRMLHAPRGENGFGYDPLFLIPSLGKTTAQLAPQQKHAISHRGQALRRLGALLEEYGLGS